jgi:hypothetical protein
MGSFADILFAGDRYMFAGKRHQFGVLRRGGRFTVDGEEDGAIVAKDDECRTVFAHALAHATPMGLSRPLVYAHAESITQPETVMLVPPFAAKARQAPPMKIDAKSFR